MKVIKDPKLIMKPTKGTCFTVSPVKDIVEWRSGQDSADKAAKFDGQVNNTLAITTFTVTPSDNKGLSK